MKVFANFFLVLLFSILSFSCIVESDDVIPSSSTSSASGSSFSASQYVYINLTENTASSDDETYSDFSSTAYYFLDGAASVSYDSATSLITVDASDITESVWIYLSGSQTTGGVKIKSSETYEIGVCLNGVTINSSNYPCIDITKGGAASVFVSGTNSLTDGREYGTGYGDSDYSSVSNNPYSGNGIGSDHKGTLYCKGGVTFYGSGSLSITQGYKNCIATKEILKIESGTYTLTSTGKSGLHGDSSVIITGGTITFNGTGSVSSSTFRKSNFIKTDTDDSTSSVYIKGGTLNATTYNGKGINSSQVYISGGTNTFNVTGVTGYTNDDNKTATYTDADGIKYTNASVTFAAEGIEGASVIQISGGETVVTATDDAINVSDTGAQFYMSDGYLYVTASGGDGIDSNGDMTISGGYIISIATTGSEDALDWASSNMDGYNGSCKITGGYIAGVSGSAESPDSVSDAGVVIISPSVSAGSSIAIGSSTSSIGFAFTVPSGVSSSSSKFFMCSPKLTSTTYTVYKGCTLSGGENWNGLYHSMPTVSSNGTTTSVTLSSHIYSSSSSSTPGGNSGNTPGGH